MNTYILISILLLIYFGYFYLNNTNLELFTNPLSIILLGDSILKNNSYVLKGQSVQELLATKTDAQIYCFAVNDSTITDANNQVNNLPQHLNEPSTIIVLSVGGNDILRSGGGGSLSSIFRQYMNLIELLKTRMDKVKIVMINLYYPTDEKYKTYYSDIGKWNELVGAYATDNALKVLDVSTILTNEDDFTYEIEPSYIGGEKLANAIASISI